MGAVGGNVGQLQMVTTWRRTSVRRRGYKIRKELGLSQTSARRTWYMDGLAACPLKKPRLSGTA